MQTVSTTGQLQAQQLVAEQLTFPLKLLGLSKKELEAEAENMQKD